MKRFSSILDAVHYMVDCPFCHRNLTFDSKGFYLEEQRMKYGGKWDTVFTFDLNGKDTITVDAETGKCTMIVHKEDDIYTSNVNGFISKINHKAYYYSIYNGTLFLRMGVRCEIGRASCRERV